MTSDIIPGIPPTSISHNFNINNLKDYEYVEDYSGKKKLETDKLKKHINSLKTISDTDDNNMALEEVRKIDILPVSYKYTNIKPPPMPIVMETFDSNEKINGIEWWWWIFIVGFILLVFIGVMMFVSRNVSKPETYFKPKDTYDQAELLFDNRLY